MSRVTVVIPNYNGMRFLQDCLASLASQSEPDVRIIVADNGSADESIAFIRREYPQVHICASPHNTGFCRAVNEGIVRARTPYVILLNNDTVCHPDFVKELCDCMDRHPDAFSAQAKMVSLDHPELIDDAGDFYCALGWAFARGKGRAASRYDHEGKIFSSCAGAAVYRKSFLEKTGLFDTAHFAYLEDLDIGYRAQLLGYRNYFAPRARVKHAGSGASGSRYNAFKVKHASRNSILVIYKNMPGWQIAVNAPMLLAGFAIKGVFFAGKGLLKEYLTGLRAGLAMREPEKRMDFSGISKRELLRIQRMLVTGLLRRIVS